MSFTINTRCRSSVGDARAGRKVSQNAAQLLTHPRQFRRTVAEAAEKGEGLRGGLPGGGGAACGYVDNFAATGGPVTRPAGRELTHPSAARLRG